MPQKSEPRTKLASKLREARELAGLTQADVANLMGKHRPTVSEIEAGRRSVTAEELAEFAKLYRVKVGWLLGENEAEDDRFKDLQLAARELEKIDKKELDKLMNLLKAIKGGVR